MDSPIYELNAFKFLVCSRYLPLSTMKSPDRRSRHRGPSRNAHCFIIRDVHCRAVEHTSIMKSTGPTDDYAAYCLCIRNRDTDLRGGIRNVSRRTHRTANRNTRRPRQHYSGLFASLPDYRAAHAQLWLVAARPVSLVSFWSGTLGILV